MKNHIILLVLILFSMNACTPNTSNKHDKAIPRIENKEIGKIELDRPLHQTDKLTSIKSYRDRNYIDGLFREYLESNKELSQYLKDLKDFKNSQVEISNEMNQFLNFSTLYYMQADQEIAQIKDSVLRQKLQTIIKNSRENFEKTNQKEIFEENQDLQNTLSDYQLAFKITITENMLRNIQLNQNPYEKLQNSNQQLKEKIEQLQELLADASN